MDRIKDVMSSPITVGLTTSVATVLTKFDRHEFNAFPVVDQHNRLQGIIAKLDLLKLFLAKRAAAGDAISTTCVADVMRRNAVFVQAHDDITSAGNLMVVTNLRSLPVVQRQGRRPVLVGMLSRGDVLRWLRFELLENTYAQHKKAS